MMKKILAVLILFIAAWTSTAQDPLQEIPSGCMVYAVGNTAALMNDPLTGRMACMFLTKNKLNVQDLYGRLAGGITPEGHAKIVMKLQKPTAHQIVQHVFREQTRRKMQVSADKKKITFHSGKYKEPVAGKGDRRKEFLQLLAASGVKEPLGALAFLGTDVPEGMEGNLIWFGLRKYAEKAVFSMEGRPGNTIYCQARIVCRSAEDAAECQEKMRSALDVIREAEQTDAFTKRVRIATSGNVLTAQVTIQSVELLACAFRLKTLLDQYQSNPLDHAQ